jgi:uncharacterized coiled-coil DUF342 family protein
MCILVNSNRYISELENRDLKTTSWQKEIIDRIIELQGKLEDARLGIGNNQNVKNHYNEASTKVAEAMEAINRFAAAYNDESRNSSA